MQAAAPQAVRVKPKKAFGNDGDSYAGVLKSETPTEIVINTPENGLVTVKKADVRRRKTALSPMPEGLGQILSQQDLRNLVEFLSSLK